MRINIALCVLSQIHERTALTYVMGEVHTYNMLCRINGKHTQMS